MFFKHVQNQGGRPDGVDGEDLAALGRAGFENPFKHLFLFWQRLGILGTGIDSDFAHVDGLVEKLLPEIDLLAMRADKLGVEAQPDTDVLRLGGDRLVLRPGPRRGGDRERVYGKALALSDKGLEIRVQVEVAMEIYEAGQVSASEDMVSIPFRNAATSSIPLV